MFGPRWGEIARREIREISREISRGEKSRNQIEKSAALLFWVACIERETSRATFLRYFSGQVALRR